MAPALENVKTISGDVDAKFTFSNVTDSILRDKPHSDLDVVSLSVKPDVVIILTAVGLTTMCICIFIRVFPFHGTSRSAVASAPREQPRTDFTYAADRLSREKPVRVNSEDALSSEGSSSEDIRLQIMRDTAMWIIKNAEKGISVHSAKPSTAAPQATGSAVQAD